MSQLFYEGVPEPSSDTVIHGRKEVNDISVVTVFYTLVSLFGSFL